MRSAVTGKDLPLLGGALCLDFVNTVDPRLEPPQEEFVPDFVELADWGRYVGVLSVSQKRAMVAEGTADPSAAAAAHSRAIELREALYRLFRAPHRPSADALVTLNEELQRATVSVERHQRAYQAVWRSTSVVDDLLGAIARSAAELLTSHQLAYVRECAGDGCGWLFLDASKAHRRRWCSMAVCGNRAKARRHRDHQRRARGSPSRPSRRGAVRRSST
jgi:predicted RNA-binding Zn ribbon-like protein